MSLELNWTRGPHIKKRGSVRLAMLEHFLALAPCMAAVLYQNPGALLLFLATAVATVGTEQILDRALSRQRSLPDGRTTISALLLALLLPADTMWWAGAVVGSLGMLTAWFVQRGRLRLRLNPAVLGALAAALLSALLPEYLSPSGQAALSATQAAPWLLAAGGAYLVWRRHVNWRTPVVILAVAAILSFALGVAPLSILVSGPFMLGTFFLAADWRTAPVTPRGKIAAAVVIGLVATLLDTYLLSAGGVLVAVLMSNLLTPPINRYTRLRPFGYRPQTTR